MLSIILPAYNEEGHIRENTIRIMQAAGKITPNYEIIIVEESRDRTPQISHELSRQYKKVRHYHFNHRLGKGLAIENGIMLARGDKVLFMDIDLATDLSALPNMVAALDSNDVVIGSRYHPQSKINRTPFRIFLGKSYALMMQVLLLSRIRDLQCGFKGIRRDAARKIIQYTRTSGTFWDTEFLFVARKLGYRITEVPVHWQEMKGRSVKIGLVLILSFVMAAVKLFFRNLWGDVKANTFKTFSASSS